MKGKRFLALALTACLCAAPTVPARAAGADFTDVKGHWALSYIQDMTAKGKFTGYEDGTFRPEVEMKRVEGFALCARATQGVDIRNQIAADSADTLNSLFPTMGNTWWFRKEAATCMALGVESGAALAEMNRTGELNEPMTKAEFAMYLVRGIGLEDLTATLDANDLPFDDEATISDLYRPYVKLLYSYGVLTGDGNNKFNPDQPMTRAVCATMLSRALENIVEERSVNVELPQYTKYAWTSGTITQVDAAENGGRVMKLQSEITGAETIDLPAAVKIYQYNKLDSFTALKTGAFAKVCYASDGKTVESVRVTPAALVEKVDGTCGKDITTDSVVIDGSPYTIDRFTQVSAGGKTGDRSIIDYLANYTDAEAGVNTQGAVLWLKLSGGTRLVDGILTDVTTETVGTTERTTITVKGYNGVSTTYQIPDTASVIVNGDAATLRESQEGRHVILRVADANLSEVKSVEVDMADRYIQGVLREVNLKSTPVRVQIKPDGDSRTTQYDVAEECAVTYRGVASELSKLAANSFVTAKIEGGTVTALYAWQGYEDTQGTLTALVYGDTATTLEVSCENGAVVRFTIPVERISSVSVTTDGKSGDLTEMRTGDRVVVTTLYNDVTQVDYTHQVANISGTLSSLTIKQDRSAELTVTFSDGSSHVYTATAATTVLQGGKPVTFSEITPGSQISMVAEGNRAVSVEITGIAARTDVIRGTVYSIDPQTFIARLRVEENGDTRLVNVYIPRSATIVTAAGDSVSNISRLSVGDVIEARGSYGASGTFEAKLVVRE